MDCNRREVLKRGGTAAVGTALLAGCVGDEGLDAGDDDADNYPEQPIELVIPFDQGGGTDVTNRALAEYLSDELGVDILPENVPGAASMRGTQQVVEASEPDGYTILAINPPSTPTSYLVHEPDFEITDLEPIASYAYQPAVVTLNPDPADDYGIDDYEDLIEAYQEDQLSAFAGQSLGSYFHVMAILLRDYHGLDWADYVAYDGTGPAVESVASGETPAGIGIDNATQSFYEDDRMEIPAIMHSDGSAIYSDTPTFSDYGLEELDFLGAVTRHYWAPPDTPQEIRDVLTEAVEDMTERDDAQATAEEGGNVLQFEGQEGTREQLEDILEIVPEEVDLDAIREQVD